MNNDIVHLISLGGGVQSSTMALMAAYEGFSDWPYLVYCRPRKR